MDIGLILRELMANAHEHGNRGNRDKSIFLKLVVSECDELRITVEDEGDGFDYSSILSPPDHDSSDNRGRGLTLIASVSKKITFNSKGNCVTVFLNVGRKTQEAPNTSLPNYQPGQCIREGLCT
jgi:anti-sigma regulatory factor (Ser/Thr protein kinase)